ITRDPLTGSADDNGFDVALDGMQRDNYRVLPLNLAQTQTVPDNADVLVIPGPKNNLTEAEFVALTDYIRNGGRVVALLDPDTPDSFVNLLAQWGVILTRESVADAVSNVAGQALTPMAQRTNGQFVPQTLIQDVNIANQLGVAYFPQASAVFTLVPPEDMPPHITFSPLAMTTPASWLESNTEQPNFDAGQEARGPFALAAVVVASGTIDENPFSDAPQARLVVFGDSDFAKNRFFFSSDNGDFFLNSVNWLADDIQLVGIRPKVLPFRELILNTRERNFIKWSSWFFPPALMLAVGAVIWWRRR
ncbi:MAG: GldG family protein, partial [Chloroflexi bacterium]|nr:GldG family protein [Chloroflexota bacterium]